jgi:hypothetical protein
MNNFKINSIVQGTAVSFFVTTVNEELVSLIQLFSEMFELSFGSVANGKVNFHFETDYDFEQFLSNESSNFYDLLVKQCRLQINGRAQHFLRELRKLLGKGGDLISNSNEIIEQLFSISLLHIDGVEADLEFDSFEGSEYEMESKEGIKEGISELASLFQELTQKNLDIKELLELLDCDITC